MGAWTFRVSTPSTAGSTSYPSGSFTPAVGELLVVSTYYSNISGTTPTLVSSANGITFTLVVTTSRAGTDDQHLWVANQLVPASPVAMTLTLGTGGSSATGAFIGCAGVSGVTRTGSAAIRQFAGLGSSGASVAVTLGAACLIANPVIAFYTNLLSPAGAGGPAGWTEQDDTGYLTPTRGWEWATIDSGFTSSSVSMTGQAGAWTYIAAEIDTSAAATTVSGSDTGAGADAASLAAAVSAADAGVGAEAATLATSLAAPDTGTGADAASLAAALSSAEVGTGVEAATLAAALTGADTGTGADAGSLAASLTASDTAAAANAATVQAGATAADTAHAADSASVAVVVVAADSGTAIDSATAASAVVSEVTLRIVSTAVQIPRATGTVGILTATGEVRTPLATGVIA